MIKYGYKTVVARDDFHKGIIVEIMSDGKVVAREYSKNEYGERQVSASIKEIDVDNVARMKTPIGKMREITKQLGTGKFAIDEEVISIIDID